MRKYLTIFLGEKTTKVAGDVYSDQIYSFEEALGENLSYLTVNAIKPFIGIHDF